MARLPTAKELNLFDHEVPEGMAISVMPPAQEHMEDPFWYDSGGRNPFHRKRVHKMTAGEERKGKLREILKEFPRYGPKMHEWAVDQDDPSLLKELFEIGASLDIKEAKRRSVKENEDSDEEMDDVNDPYPSVNMQPALHVAAFEGKLECVKVLVIDGHADVNARDEHDTTPLTNALADNREDVVDWLLEHGCNISYKRGSDDGLDDLRSALRSTKISLVRKILEHPQSVEQKLRIEPADLAYAASSRGNPQDVVRFVLESDCFKSPITRAQTDELHKSLPYAIASTSFESVRLMLRLLTNERDDGSFEYVELPEPVQAAVFNATEDAMERGDIADLFELVWETLLSRHNELLDTQAKPTITKEERLNRRLISACAEGCIDTCRLLVEKYGAEIHHVSHKISSTPLGRATGSTANPLWRRLPVAKYLLEEKHANIHLASGQFANGATPLAMILKCGPTRQDEMTKLLLKNGGPLEETNDVVWKMVERAPAGAMIKLNLVHHEVSRDPVTLMTDEQLKNDVTEVERTEVAVEASKEEWDAWLETMQVRKTNEQLSAEDPKGRSLG